MGHIYIPTTSPEDWQRFLAEPDKQWKKGYSARALAYCWQEANGLPTEVKKVFPNSGVSLFGDIEMVLALPEHKTPLPGGSRPSQSDIFVLARAGNRLVAITVEGKVSEPFGPTVAEWLKKDSPGKQKRLAFLCDTLQLEVEQVSSLRYQLLHRTVSALLEARRFCAHAAVMLVHSFSPTNTWFEDYADFLALFGLEGQVNMLHSAGTYGDTALYLGWVKGDSIYLER